jgi:hypothetical protein
MAGSTRLELATSGVTGRRSNQLNYDPFECPGELRRRPFQAATVTSLPCASTCPFRPKRIMGGKGFEPLTAGV